MATTFWIEVTLHGVNCFYTCEMMGMHFHVSGKNKSILISHDGLLIAGELKPEFVQPIFQAIQQQVSPADRAKIISIQRRIDGQD